MKIYIKTEMEDLPKSCAECRQLAINGCSINYAECNGIDVLEYCKNETKPSWCPLISEKQIIKSKAEA